MSSKTDVSLYSLANRIGDSSGDTLTDLRTKFGNIARTLDLILGARWDAGGDLGSDIVTLLAAAAADVAITGTVVDAGAAVTDFDTSLLEVTNNHYNGMLLMFTSGVCLNQAHLVDVYTGASKNVAFAASDQWTDVPANGDAFVLIPKPGVYLKKIFTAMALAATALTNVTWTDARAGYLDYLVTLLAAGVAASGTVVDVGATIVDFDTSLVEATDDHYNGMFLLSTSGVTAGQGHQIDDYTGGTKNVAFAVNDQWTEAPANGSTFVILPNPGGYLKKIFTAMATSAEIAALDAVVNKAVFFKDQWCATPIASLAFSNVAGDKDFSNVVLPANFLPASAVIQAVHLMVHWRKQVDTSAALNAINAAAKTIRVKKAADAWNASLVAITMANGGLSTALSATEGGTIIIGNVDIKAKVDADNTTYNVRSDETSCADGITVTAASLTLWDIYTGLRVYFTVA